MEGIGILTKEDAISFGASGPVGRASGYSCAVRKHHSYSTYDKVKFNEVLKTKGDTYASYQVRILEMWESLSIIEQLIDNIPEGDFKVATNTVIKLPEGEYYERVETARGELGVYIISTGTKNPYRVKFRSPGFSNLSLLNHIAVGGKIGDLVATMATLDLVIPDIDR